MVARAGKGAARPVRRDRPPNRLAPSAGIARRLIQALDGLPHGFCLFDAADRLVFVSAGFRRLFGARFGPDPGGLRAARRRLPGRGATDPVLRVLSDGRRVAITVHPQAGGGWAALCEDVTERSRTEALLRDRAHHDPLTGLANRYRFAALLDRALAGPASCALLCIDLDGFKPVNDRHGHAVGDALLRDLAGRLRADLGDRDSAARIGGDEFAVLLGDAASALAFAHRLHRRLTAPYDLGAQQPIRIGAAIGLACAPLHATRPGSLMERADAAMYAAKRCGRPCLWDASMVFGSAPSAVFGSAPSADFGSAPSA